jgi:Transposase DDE domain
MSATATVPWRCSGGWTAADSPDCGMAGLMAATTARFWSGQPSIEASPSRWYPAAMAGVSRAGCRPGATPPIVSPFAVVPRRWVVERTFAWLGRYRRLSKDYEYLTATSEAVIYLAMTRLLLRRLTRP